MRKMTKEEIKVFAEDYPYYSTDYVEILLIGNDYNQEKVREVLAKPTNEVVKMAGECIVKMREKRQMTWNKILSSFTKV